MCVSSCVCVCVCECEDIYIHIANVVFFFFATPHGMWILVPQPGIESIPPALEVQNLNHWTIGEVPANVVFLVLGHYESFGGFH